VTGRKSISLIVSLTAVSVLASCPDDLKAPQDRAFDTGRVCNRGIVYKETSTPSIVMKQAVSWGDS
jgi:hypothetical protein